MSYLLIEYQKSYTKTTASIVSSENGDSLIFPELEDAKLYAINFLGFSWTTAKLDD